MILSILIPAITSQKGYHKRLTEMLTPQLTEGVEVLWELDERVLSTGAKRNRLIERAKGTYTVFVDSDDTISPDYVSSILEAAKEDSDAIVFNGVMTTDGKNERKWFISKDYPYEASRDNNGNIIYLRYPNHIVPIKRSITSQVRFQDLRMGEDYLWATKIHELGLIKTETKINKFLYRYEFIPNK